MKKLALALGLMIALGGTAVGQQPVVRAVNELKVLSTDVSPTPSMWFYEQQMREYKNPEAAVRQKAEFQTAARMRRMADSKWFGMSHSRPRGKYFANEYSPYWASYNRMFPGAWYGVASGYYVTPTPAMVVEK